MKYHILPWILVLTLLTGCMAMPEPLDRQVAAESGAGNTQTESESTAQNTAPVAESSTSLPNTEETTIPEETTEPEETQPETSEATEPAPTEAAQTDTSREPVTVLPLCYQNDDTGQRYGDGTLDRNGGSAACLAMVGSWFLGYAYTPSEIARYFGGKAQTDMDRLEFGSQAMGLSFWRAENFDKAMAALAEGKTLIVMEGSKSWFSASRSQHFIVLSHMDENGNIFVLDPYKPNYTNWYLKDKYQTGFTRSDILTGFQAAWIYDKAAMPENPVLYEPPAKADIPRYPTITLTEADKDLIAKVIWGEARGEPLDGQQAVAEVILNRLASDAFPNTVSAIVKAPGQFLSQPNWYKATPNQTQYDAIEDALEGPYVLPENVTQFSTGKKSGLEVWGQIGSHYFFYQP